MYSILNINHVKKHNDLERKIISISVFRYENNEIIDQIIITLNPETLIDDSLEKHINITNNRLKKAPKFYEIAKRILEIINNTIIVCVNKETQSEILVSEFKSLGFKLTNEIIDIKNKLDDSKSLYDTYLELGIPCTKEFSPKLNGLALVKLFKIIKEQDINKDLESSEKTIIQTNLHKLQRDLPNKIGLFYIYNKENEIIYLNYSSNIKNHITNIFTSNKELFKQITKNCNLIKHDLTGSILIAKIKALISQAKINPPLNSPIETHNKEIAIFKPEISFIIKDKGRNIGENSFIYIESGTIKGYGYSDLNHQLNSKAKINCLITVINETKEILKLVHNFINEKKYIEIINL